MYETVTEIDGR